MGIAPSPDQKICAGDIIIFTSESSMPELSSMDYHALAEPHREADT